MLQRLLFLLILGLLPLLGQTQDAANEDLFQKGLAAYQNKQFDEARENFQKLVNQGESSANLLHNLALTEYQLDHKARALALWRKALSENPGFKPAKEAREFVESQGQMRPFERDSVSLGWSRTLEGVTLQELLLLTAAIFALSGTLWIRYLGQRRIALEDQKAMPGFPVTAIIAEVVFLAVLALVGLKLQARGTTTATVVGEKVNIKSLPSESGVPLADINPGNELRVRRHQDGWAQVVTSDGVNGWVKAGDIFVTSGKGL